jgi:hypothetical protein
VLGALACWVLACAADENLEYQVKAVFLLRMAQFAHWPEAALGSGGQPFVIGIVGRDPFGHHIDDAVRGEQVAGRPVVVRRYAAPDALGPAHLLFIGDSHARALGGILARLDDAPTLTVADFAGFVGRGGAIELFLDRGRVRFRIDRSAAHDSGVELSSKLLRSAAAVRED